jgi:hypothetical protein
MLKVLRISKIDEYDRNVEKWKNVENGENGLVEVADRPNQSPYSIYPNPYPYPSRFK